MSLLRLGLIRDVTKEQTRSFDKRLSPQLKIALVFVRLDRVADRIVTANRRTGCNAICGGVNVGDALRQVEGLVMVWGSEWA